MPELSNKDIVLLLQYLLPGFLVAWVFHGLTTHPKSSQFERIIQALIFTLGVRALVFGERVGLEFIGRWISFGPWDSDADLACSLLSALLLGFALAYLVNTDGFHKQLRRLGISKRSAHSSEWCGVLSERMAYVVLNLKDGLRLYGWPTVWPSDPDKGHFFITHASWIGDDGKDIPLSSVEGLCINASDVKWIEFLNKPKESNYE